MKLSRPLTIRAVTSSEEFKGLASEWEALLNTVPGHSMFLTWEWLYYWAIHYLGDSQLRILLAFDEHERLVGIAPLYLRRSKHYAVISVRELRLLGSEFVGSSYLDLIVQEQHKPAMIQSLYEYLFGDAGDEWDILTFSAVPAESSTLDLWKELCDDAGKVVDVVTTSCCPVIQLPVDLDTYRASLGRNRRYTLQRKTRYLQEAGQMQFARATSPTDVEAAFESVITLHQRRWSSRPGGGVFTNERARRFHRDIVRVLSERGRVSIDLLLLDGRPIAGIYGFMYRGVYYFYLPGFDPDSVPKASPGVLLLHQRIHQAMGEGAQMVDLLQGSQPYKLEWSTGLRRLMTSRYYNRHASAAALTFLDGAKQALKILLR
jgi:CelD/BcsL family acetyltransferase involved in cellulose biosynthesis